MNLENMQRSMFYLTSRDAKRVMTDSSDKYFHQQHFASKQKSLRLSTTSGSNVMAQTVILMFLMTLTLTVGICYIDCHKK